LTEKFDETKGVMRSHKSKDRQYKDQMKKKEQRNKQRSTKHYTHN